MSDSMAASGNKYVRGLVTVVVGFVILAGLLWLGEAIANSRSDEAFGLTLQGAFGIGGWLTWLIIGAVVLYIIYILFADAEMFAIGTREVVMMAIGAALYGVITFVFNTIPVPSVSLVALRPTVAIPIFFGFAFGPAVGFFAGAFGNVLGDALTGWGVFPVWDIGNGLMGLVAGLAGLYLMGRTRSRTSTLLWIGVAILAVFTVLLLAVFPNSASNFTGASLSGWWIIALVVLVVVLVTSFAPQVWPYLMLLLTLGVLVWGIYSGATGGFNAYAIVFILWAIVMAGFTYFLFQRAQAITEWLGEDDTKDIVAWGTLGVIVGIGFAAIADIFINGYTFETAMIGEFVPAAIPNVLFSAILTPLLYAAWKQARAQAGR